MRQAKLPRPVQHETISPLIFNYFGNEPIIFAVSAHNTWDSLMCLNWQKNHSRTPTFGHLQDVGGPG